MSQDRLISLYRAPVPINCLIFFFFALVSSNPNDPSLAEQSRDGADAARYRAPIWELFDPIDRRYLELGELKEFYGGVKLAV